MRKKGNNCFFMEPVYAALTSMLFAVATYHVLSGMWSFDVQKKFPGPQGLHKIEDFTRNEPFSNCLYRLLETTIKGILRALSFPVMVAMVLKWSEA